MFERTSYSQLLSLPTIFCVDVCNKFFCTGGIDKSRRVVNSVVSYYMKKWQEESLRMEMNRCSFAVAQHDKTLYVSGG